MTAIANAISALNQSLDNLETAATAQEQKALQLKQRDLFTNGKPANGHASNGHALIDPAVLAKKLDVTIERIEQVLREG